MTTCTNSLDLAKIDYSDSTHDISFFYDRIGRRKNVTDAQGTRVFAYGEDLGIESEHIERSCLMDYTREAPPSGYDTRIFIDLSKGEKMSAKVYYFYFIFEGGFGRVFLGDSELPPVGLCVRLQVSGSRV